jgi:hypothetical protein
VDWSWETHAVCVVDDDGQVIERFTVAHSAAGLAQLTGRLRRRGAAAVAIERGDGPVVQALLDADLQVFVITSRQVKARCDCATAPPATRTTGSTPTPRPRPVAAAAAPVPQHPVNAGLRHDACHVGIRKAAVHVVHHDGPGLERCGGHPRRVVSTMTASPAEASSVTTGTIRRTSSSGSTRSAPGRVDSPPTSM